MKLTAVSIVVFLIVCVCVSGCAECECALPPQEPIAVLLLSTEWNKPVVTVDGVDQSDLYQNFTIKFIKDTYTSSGGTPLWATTGTWTFKDEAATTLTLDGKTEVKINEITESTLELEIQNDNTTFVSGRTNSIKGKNVFKLKKK